MRLNPLTVRFGTAMVVIGVSTGIVVAATVSPAAAHGGAVRAPVNYEITVDSIAPAVETVTARTTDLGEHMTLTVRGTATTVLVRGYSDEPYLRIDRDGVWRNERSPATFFNRTLQVEGEPPAGFDAAAEPEWKRISKGTTASWHDHRLHPNGQDRETLWRIVISIDGEAGAIVGITRVLPPPPVWSGFALALGCALTAVLAVRGRRASGLAFVACVVGVGSIAIAVGRWVATTDPITKRFAITWPIIGVVLLAVALARLRRGVGPAAPWLIFGCGALGIAFGAALVPWLTHARLPASGPPTVWRAMVAVVLAYGGVGVVVSLRALRPSASLTREVATESRRD